MTIQELLKSLANKLVFASVNDTLTITAKTNDGVEIRRSLPARNWSSVLAKYPDVASYEVISHAWIDGE
jgi:hypothetical protein